MNENLIKLRVGIFVLIAMFILGILIVLNSEGWSPQYKVYIKPTSAPGVKPGTPIRKNGILIGRVKKVEPVDLEGYVLLELGINQDSKLYSNEVCSIGSESLLGDAAIEVLALPLDERGELVAYDQVMQKVAIRRDPFKMLVDLQPHLSETLKVVQDAGRSVEEAGKGIADITSTLQTAFEDEGSDFKALLGDLRQMSVKAQSALDNFNRIFENVNNVVGDPQMKGQIKKALAEVPKIFQEIRVTIADTREAVNAFGTIPEGVNNSLENIEALTQDLRKRSPEVLSQINASLKNVDDLVDQVKQFTSTLSKIDPNEGSIGKLLNDTEIYDSILETVRNVEETSTKIEPLVNDLRLFADTIARNPGSLVSGAVRPGKTDYKGSAGRDGGLRSGRNRELNSSGRFR